jgi:hypothetical protein
LTDQRVASAAYEGEKKQTAGDAHVLLEVEQVSMALGASQAPVAVPEERGGERERGEDDREHARPDADYDAEAV